MFSCCYNINACICDYLCKTLYVNMQILAHFWSLKAHKLLTTNCYVIQSNFAHECPQGQATFWCKVTEDNKKQRCFTSLFVKQCNMEGLCRDSLNILYAKFTIQSLGSLGPLKVHSSPVHSFMPYKTVLISTETYLTPAILQCILLCDF